MPSARQRIRQRWAAVTIREARQSRYNTTLLEVVGQWIQDADRAERFRARHATLVAALPLPDPHLTCVPFFTEHTPCASCALRHAHHLPSHDTPPVP